VARRALIDVEADEEEAEAALGKLMVPRSLRRKFSSEVVEV